MKNLTITLLCIIWCNQNIHAQIHAVLNDTVKERGEWLHFSDMHNVFHKVLVEELLVPIKKREAEVVKIKTIQAVETRRENAKAIISNLIGEFPDKTPLNVQSLGFIDKGFCTIEKILFESQPGLFVTSAVFKPKKPKKKKLPAILYLSGHTDDAFRSKTYQNVIYNLVKKGYLVMAIDPMGQGERIEEVNEVLPFEYTSNNLYHSYLASQNMLANQSLTKYQIWDGIRAIDYLSTRKDVDMDNLGATGRSGGGTQTAWLGVFEERLKATAIENYITSSEYLLKSIGLQDGEQNINYAIENGIGFADLVLARAPKPTMIIATEADFFNIQGTKDSYAELEKYYDLLGLSTQLHWQSDVAGHTSTQPNRIGLYDFFNTYLGGSNDTEDVETVPIPSEQFLILDDAHAEDMFNRTITDINREEYLLIKQRKAKSGFDLTAENLENSLGIKWMEGKTVKVNEVKHKGHTVEKYFVDTDEYPLPFLVAKPNKPNGAVILNFSLKGKKCIEDERMIRLLDQGYAVILADVLGIGELGEGQYGGTSIPMTPNGVPPIMWFTANQSNRSILGRWIADMHKVTEFAIQHFPEDEIHLWASDYLTIPALHLPFFFESNRLSSVGLYGMLHSWESLITNKFYDPKWIVTTIPGITYKYDISDLMQYHQKVEVYAITDQKSNRLQKEQLKGTVFEKRLKPEAYTVKEEYEALFSHLRLKQ